MEEVNQRIQREMEERVARYRDASPEEIDHRLRELDHEWDTERTLEANAATLAFTGSALALTSDRRWAWLPLVVTGFLFQHALQGWCPPLPIIRRLGFRTIHEIDRERQALRALRGGFRRSAPSAPRSDVAEERFAGAAAR
ncbi:hypothetical protein CA12_27780 [Alienimonas californiensis]|uniref:DUF2892 domain-containing protein n=2 Tax=Alienimonas californiensis TaxID=2527989 RepID=A0A517PBE0_9PLAN|nr:hypothetical protein CA12_27780 [Alienimonas californiensis]